MDTIEKAKRNHKAMIIGRREIGYKKQSWKNA